MTFYAVFRKDSGELYSTGSTVADAATLAKDGLAVAELAAPPDDRQEWNPKAHRFDPAPPVPPVAEQVAAALGGDAEYATLSGADKALLARFAARLTAVHVIEPAAKPDPGQPG